MMSDFKDPNPELDHFERLRRLEEARAWASQLLGKAQEVQQVQYNRHRHTRTYEPGDLVLVHWVQGRAGQSNRFRNRYIGPFRVLSKREDVYWLQNLSATQNRPKEEPAHVSRLKPYYARENRGHATGRRYKK